MKRRTIRRWQVRSTLSISSPIHIPTSHLAGFRRSVPRPLRDQSRPSRRPFARLDRLGQIIGYEAFPPTLAAALAYGDGTRGGRPPYDPVAMLKVLVLAAQNNVADARMEYLIRDRLSWLRFLGFDLGAPTPDANTIRLFREKLTEAGALDAVFSDFDRQLKERGYLAMGGQIVDATLVAAPKQRNTAPEKDAIKAGKSAREIWPDKPARAAQKDTDARWTLKFAKAKPLANGKPGIDIAIPSFGYKSSVSICRTFGFIRKCKVTDAARFDERMLRDVVISDNTASDVWADTAYRSQANEAWLKRQSRVSRIHREKPRARQCPSAQRRPTSPNQRFAPASNMCSPGKKTRWGCSSAPSASSAPRPRSRSPTSLTTCTA